MIAKQIYRGIRQVYASSDGSDTSHSKAIVQNSAASNAITTAQVFENSCKCHLRKTLMAWLKFGVGGLLAVLYDRKSRLRRQRT